MDCIFNQQIDEAFELSIYVKDSEKNTTRYQQTLKKRRAESASIHYQTEKFEISGDLQKSYEIHPLFFENTQYHFEIQFRDPIHYAELRHKLVLINDSFRFSQVANMLVGVINTGNDIGQLSLPIYYEDKVGKGYSITLSFMVLPTKIDLQQDIEPINEAIDGTFPLWRFNLTAKTEQGIGKTNEKGYFPLFWLAHFQQLQQQFTQALKIIKNSPHNRLQTYSLHQKAERLKGKLSAKQTHRIKNDLASGLHHKKYAVEKKKLSVNTPENRFIKQVIIETDNKLTQINQTLAKSSKNQFSKAFFDTLNNWQKPLKQFQALSFFNEIGTFKGLEKISLVLQQKPGYSTVFHIWQELRFYLQALSHQSFIAHKSLSELYEVWCFLAIRRLLVEELGFEEISSQKAKLMLSDQLDFTMKDGMYGAFHFERPDGLKIKLAHEPIFHQKTEIRSYLNTQKPDILLEVLFPNKQRFIWLFDAKYRLNSDNGEDDLVPDDAINQMHRYRDALVWAKQDEGKSRPVFGAYALYPGFFDQANMKNPYQAGIDEVGIGAFALLPSQQNQGAIWLRDFFKAQLGNYLLSSPLIKEEHLFVQEQSRIPYTGMKQQLYTDLTMLVSLGHAQEGENVRSIEYFARFKNGTAKYYHLPQDTFEMKYKGLQHIVNEIAFLGLAEQDEQGNKIINKVWQVKRVSIVKRNTLTEEQAGYISDSERLDYLFELGIALNLPNPIRNVPLDGFRKSMKLTTLAQINNVAEFNSIEPVYTEFYLNQ